MTHVVTLVASHNESALAARPVGRGAATADPPRSTGGRRERGEREGSGVGGLGGQMSAHGHYLQGDTNSCKRGADCVDCCFRSHSVRGWRGNRSGAGNGSGLVEPD